MYLEMKRTAILLCDGKTAEEILELSVNENIYQLDKEKRRRSMPLKMTKRLSFISANLIQALADSPTDKGKLIAFLAMMKSERLVGEYMLDVYANKMDFDEITDLDFMQFADRLATNSETVANWKADTLKDLHSKIKNILCDAGLAKRTKKAVMVQKAMVDDDFRQLLDEDDWLFAKAMLLEV